MTRGALTLSSRQVWVKPSPRIALARAHRSRGLGQWRGGLPSLFDSGNGDRSQFDIAGNALRDANGKLQGIEAHLRQVALSAGPGGATPELETLLRDSIKARDRYNSLLQAYIYAYGIAFGPPDTTGLELGQWQVYVASGVGIAVLLAAIYELDRFLDILAQRAQAQAAAAQSQIEQQQNIAHAQEQLEKCQSAGDAACAAQWAAVIKANQAYQGGAPGGETFMQWIMRNAGWVAAGAVAVLIVPRLLR